MSSSINYLINGDYLNGISPLDRGVAYGDGVFRTFTVVAGEPIRWPLHYQKLVQDCSAIDIVCPSATLLMDDINVLFSVIDSPSVCKIMITRGEGSRGYALPSIVNPNRIVIKSPMPHYPDDYYSQGVDLFVCKTQVAHQPQLAGIKHLNRLENVMARAELSDLRFYDGLMLDVNGHVIECTSANIFARFNDTLCTPILTHCGVAGVTRQSIINISQKLGFSIKQTLLPLNQLLKADEIIICNSVYGAWQVKRLADITWSPMALAEKIRLELQTR